jgi:TolB-like protein/class 3 adenylate cyclase
MERRLAAILAADMVGYSKLMAADEVGTIKRQKAHRTALIDPKIDLYGGRIVKTTGDGMLVEFTSVVNAVQCAVEIQRVMPDQEAQFSADQRIRYRIGINLGDIFIDGDDILGDGVNIAARLEGLAEPGGVCVSRAVHTQVEGKVDLSFEDLGEQAVKNIPKPVQVFRVQMDAPVGDRDTIATVPAMRPLKRPAVAAGLALLVIVAGIALWQRPWERREEPALVANMAFPLPDKPSIAVLPFRNMSEDQSQEYFADGMTEDLITDLSKISGLFVIARNSSFSYKAQNVKVRKVAEDLGVRYVLEGSVRRAGDEVRINAQLIDATTGGHVWAERYDRKLDNIFAVQNAITAKIVQALELHLTDSEQEQMDKEPRRTNVEAYDLVLRSRKLLTQFDHKAAAEARGLLKRAIEIDPAYAEAYSLLGFYFFDEWRVWGSKRDQNLARALALAATAVELSPSDPAPHVLLALVYQWRREFDAANAEADKALALQPNDAITLSNLGSMLKLAGRYEEALPLLEQAVRLDPFHPPNYLERLADAYAGVGNYIQCVEVAERGAALDPNFVGLHGSLASCYGALGRDEEAKAAVAEMLRTNPNFTLRAWAAYVPYSHERDLQRALSLLRNAGVPE